MAVAALIAVAGSCVALWRGDLVALVMWGVLALVGIAYGVLSPDAADATTDSMFTNEDRALLRDVHRLLRGVLKLEVGMTQVVDDLVARVQGLTDADEAMTVVLTHNTDELRALIAASTDGQVDAAKLQALVDQADAERARVVAATLANTLADPTLPPAPSAPEPNPA